MRRAYRERPRASTPPASVRPWRAPCSRSVIIRQAEAHEPTREVRCAHATLFDALDDAYARAADRASGSWEDDALPLLKAAFTALGREALADVAAARTKLAGDGDLAD
jgi:hypothetical protein